MHAKLINEAGKVKEVKVGFSWATLLFGGFVPLVRGDILWCLIMFVVNIVVGVITEGAGTAALTVIWAFTYNKTYVNGLIKKGYKPASDADEQTLKSKKYI